MREQDTERVQQQDAEHDWKDERVMPIEHLLPPFRTRSDSPLGQHFAKLDAEMEKEKAPDRRKDSGAGD